MRGQYSRCEGTGRFQDSEYLGPLLPGVPQRSSVQCGQCRRVFIVVVGPCNHRRGERPLTLVPAHKSVTTAHDRAALRYQQRRRQDGLCVNCPDPALVKTITDPITGKVVLTHVMVHCYRHWQVARERNVLAEA